MHSEPGKAQDRSTLPPSGARPRPRSLALVTIEALGDQTRDGRLGIGNKLPTVADVMAVIDVSRRVMHEGLSKLQATSLVEVRHGIGAFVLGAGEPGSTPLPPAMS